MQITGYDAKVAAENGYEIRSDASGQYSVLKGTPRGDRLISPSVIVRSNCGISYVELYDIGVRKYRVETGFGLYDSAVGYNWHSPVTGPGYNNNHAYSGGLWFSTTWEGTAVAVVPTGANYMASANGWAILANGGICTSLVPTDLRPIY